MSETHVQPPALWYDILLFPHTALENSDEYALGMRDLRRRLPGARRWYIVGSEEEPPSPGAFAEWSDAPFVLVILNPALLASDNLEEELLSLVGEGMASCVLPSDPRGCVTGAGIDYASRPGFDRFVSRLSAGVSWMPFDGRIPWLYLVSRQALATCHVSWQMLPAYLGTRTQIAGHAFVHSYADYYESDRIDMLRLIPDKVSTLLDIGGGAGNFGMAFMRERGGQATLLEQNRVMAHAARQKGLAVLEGDFYTITLPERYDCVAFLDVLEHISDPLAALIKARQALKPGGRVLLSVPNVGHWSVAWDLLEGRFEYLPLGILCTTHLRFFTRSGLNTLLRDAGLEIERWEDEASPLPAPFVTFLESRVTPEVTPDFESLTTACFRVLARRSGGA